MVNELWHIYISKQSRKTSNAKYLIFSNTLEWKCTFYTMQFKLDKSILCIFSLLSLQKIRCVNQLFSSKFQCRQLIAILLKSWVTLWTFKKVVVECEVSSWKKYNKMSV